MDRVFLDSNILFSAAYRADSDLRQLWNLASTELLSCPFAAQEALTNLSSTRPGQLADLSALMTSVRLVPDPPAGATLPAGVVLPDKDKPILLAAIAGQATHFLTGDVRHFGPYFGQTIAGVLVLRPAAFIRSRQGIP